MTIKTLLLYLVGNRPAILAVAHCRGGLWLGLALVMSAALAREYDGHDLLHEPWHLLIPAAASLGSSLALYLLVYLVSLVRGPRGWPSLANYRAILQLFWMTAPLAWLYAIPFERFMSPGDATRANLCLLGLVALWRVLLMSRAISVLYRVQFFAALSVVMLFADLVLWAALELNPLPDPILVGMSGIRLSESDRLLSELAFYVRILGILTFPVWFIATLSAAALHRWNAASGPSPAEHGVTRGLWLVATASLAVWMVVLPFTQPEQWNRWQVERALHASDISQAIAYMSEHPRTAFPPHWDPPPRLGFDERIPSLISLRAAVSREGVAEWVRDLYVEKFGSQLAAHRYSFSDPFHLKSLDNASLRDALENLRQISEGPEIAGQQRDWANHELDFATHRGYLTHERAELLEGILELAGPEKESQTSAMD